MRGWAPRQESASMRASVAVDHTAAFAGRLATAFVELALAAAIIVAAVFVGHALRERRTEDVPSRRFAAARAGMRVGNEPGRQLSDLAHRLSKGRQRRIEHLSHGNVVEADDGDIFGYTKPVRAQGGDRAKREKIALG